MVQDSSTRGTRCGIGDFGMEGWAALTQAIAFLSYLCRRIDVTWFLLVRKPNLDICIRVLSTFFSLEL